MVEFKVNDTLIGENVPSLRGKRVGRAVRAGQCEPCIANHAVRAVQCQQCPVFVNYTLALALQLTEIAR
jgi:hypothetical protein